MHDDIGLESDAIALLEPCKALLTDTHVVLSSGAHSIAYFEKRRVTFDPAVSFELGRLFAAKVRQLGVPVGVVVSPAYGAPVLGMFTAYHLDRTVVGRVGFVTAEKVGDDSFRINDADAERIKGANVVVVEDVWTSGNSALATLGAVRVRGGKVTGVVSLVDRSDGAACRKKFGVPCGALVKLNGVPKWTPEECADHGPCSQGVEIATNIGYGATWVAEHGQPK